MATEKHSILIIDDEKSSLNVLTHILRQDYGIYTAKDGKTGLEIADEYMPALILLDIVMPDMDGYEVLAHLKASEKTKNIPVIFITGLDAGQNGTTGRAPEAAEYIYKPFHAADVKEKVDAQINIMTAR